ncbi:MAG: sigma-E processing peptidase SpoIIGA [Oscillospiraceae bacterium]|nr:sigma-E processing peptidase SpoIIGA [Oscillospiraceae bacterium]
MPGYAALVMLLGFSVELLLLLAADRLCGYYTQWNCAVLTAAVSGVYGGLCLLPQLAYLRATGFRYAILSLMPLLCNGLSVGTLSRGAVFVLLNMAVDGVVADFNLKQIWLLGLYILLIILLCHYSVQREKQEVAVEIQHNGKNIRLCALRDTGNTLTDPITGRSVLVVGADAALHLLGLTKEQLRFPLETLTKCPVQGLRLIPYQTIDRGQGFMLAIQMQKVTIENKTKNCLVAFAPEGLGREGKFQALTGGMI